MPPLSCTSWSAICCGRLAAGVEPESLVVLVRAVSSALTLERLHPDRIEAAPSSAATASRDARCRVIRASSLCVVGKDVVPVLYNRVAGESALGVVALRRVGCCGGGREFSGYGVILECAPSPSATIRETLAVLHHEIHVVLPARNSGGGEGRHLGGEPVDLRHLGAIRERLAVAGSTRLVGLDHHRIAEDGSHRRSVLAD